MPRTRAPRRLRKQGVLREGRLGNLTFGRTLIEVIEFDPLEEFAPEQPARVISRLQSEHPAPVRNLVAGPLMPRRGFMPRGLRVSWTQSLGFAVLLVAAAAPWVLLTRDRIDSSARVSGLEAVIEGVAPSRIGDASPGTPPAVRQVGPSGRTKVARANSRSDGNHYQSSDAATGASVPVRGSGRGANAAFRTAASGTTASPPDVVQVFEPEIRQSTIFDESSESRLESQSRTQPTMSVSRAEVTAEAFDAEGDVITFNWTAPVGSFVNPTAQHTEFICPSTPATVPVTIAVTDANGAVARDTITVRCVAQSR